MRRRTVRDRLGRAEVKLQMTPMIDVVFQLLIFFVITLSPVDIFSHLEVSRPAPPLDPPPPPPDPIVRIDVSPLGYRANARRMDLPALERWLTELQSIRKDSPVLIVCTMDSDHSRLVQVLDLCSKLGLERLSIGSSGPNSAAR